MCILFEDAGVRYSGHQEKAIRKVGEMVAGNGGRVFADLQQVAAFLNAAALGVGPGDEPCAYQT